MSKRICFNVTQELAKEVAAFRVIHEDSAILDKYVARQVAQFIKKTNENRGVKVKLSTPDCPDCGSKMVERKKGERKFLGCSSYPKCKKTLNIQK
ncbi:topoisomerase DNA-binding C4 zinc finger domain-containing protein [Vibrio sp. D431a]|uniref:topoisomerase DNA-binding C4 zinc finger domain-containing protein n=1 Tax=Vibrio sp. D431a TaxID=2837388 RepID=UPI00255285A3|nr:topoisomerase DNA-binding C4 zinc finger domain-containing protein [Vibrio sp. D431a]MDK9793880.1 topoisomerase DNA-binding C4 zinc finger domain-containing protein [Vibrio sp. D431a]